MWKNVGFAVGIAVGFVAGYYAVRWVATREDDKFARTVYGEGVR